MCSFGERPDLLVSMPALWYSVPWVWRGGTAHPDNLDCATESRRHSGGQVARFATGEFGASGSCLRSAHWLDTIPPIQSIAIPLASFSPRMELGSAKRRSTIFSGVRI